MRFSRAVLVVYQHLQAGEGMDCPKGGKEGLRDALFVLATFATTVWPMQAQSQSQSGHMPRFSVSTSMGALLVYAPSL